MSERREKVLPKWVLDREGEHDEAAECRLLTPDQRGERLVQCCRLAMEVLRNRADRESVLAYRDPLPESSIALLEMLRRRYADRSPCFW